MKILLAAALAAAALAVTPADAAKMMTCKGDGPMKVAAMKGAMSEGAKSEMNKQVAMMNMSMSKGDMRGCHKAIMGAQRAAMMK